MNKIAIIVPVWGKLEFTKKFVLSLYKTTPHDQFTLVVVDNASPDKTPKWLEKQKNHYSNLVVLTNEENTGYVGGINRGLTWLDEQEEKPEYIIFANNDVELGEQWSEKMLHWFTEYENLGGLGAISNAVAGAQHIQWNLSFGNSFQVAQYLIGFWYMIPYKVYEEVGKLDDSFGMGFSDDIDYSIRIKQSGKWALGIARDVFIKHEGSASYKTLHKSNNDYQKDLEEKHAILVKKWGEELVEKTMHITYFHESIIFPSKEYLYTQFTKSLFDLWNGTNKKLQFLNGRSTSYTSFMNNELAKSLGEYTLLVNDNVQFKPTVLDDLKSQLQTHGVEVYIVTGKEPITGQRVWHAIYMKSSVVNRLEKPYFEYSTKDEECEIETFIAQLKKNKVAYMEVSLDEQGIFKDIHTHSEYLEVEDPHAQYDVTIGIPCVEMVHNNFVIAMLSFLSINSRPVQLVMTQKVQVDRARNHIVSKMKGKALLFVDSDQTFPVDSLDRLMSLRVPIATGVVYKKVHPYMPCVYRKSTERYGYTPIYNALIAPRYNVDMCGCGFVLIRKEVIDAVRLEHLGQPLFAFTRDHGEDIHFFEKAVALGYDIIADATIPIGHVTQVEIGAEDHYKVIAPQVQITK